MLVVVDADDIEEVKEIIGLLLMNKKKSFTVYDDEEDLLKKIFKGDIPLPSEKVQEPAQLEVQQLRSTPEEFPPIFQMESPPPRTPTPRLEPAKKKKPKLNWNFDYHSAPITSDMVDFSEFYINAESSGDDECEEPREVEETALTPLEKKSKRGRRPKTETPATVSKSSGDDECEEAREVEKKVSAPLENKPKRGRRPKTETPATISKSSGDDECEEQREAEETVLTSLENKPKRGRRPKTETPATISKSSGDDELEEAREVEKKVLAPIENKPKRGRPPKTATPAILAKSSSDDECEDARETREVGKTVLKTLENKPKRGRPPKTETPAIMAKSENISECIVCEKCRNKVRITSFTVQELSNHALVHTDLKKYACPIINCTVTARQRSVVAYHIAKIHKMESRGVVIPDILTPEENARLEEVTYECFPDLFSD